MCLRWLEVGGEAIFRINERVGCCFVHIADPAVKDHSHSDLSFYGLKSQAGKRNTHFHIPSLFISGGFHIPEGIPAPVDRAHATSATSFCIIGYGIVYSGSGWHGEEGQGIFIVIIGIQDDPELVWVSGLLISFFTGGGNVARVPAKQSCSDP